ncbi:MAG: hypothetical protein ABI294_07105, partial [Casimicrobiaceae bacterium]
MKITIAARKPAGGTTTCRGSSSNTHRGGANRKHVNGGSLAGESALRLAFEQATAAPAAADEIAFYAGHLAAVGPTLAA